MCDDVAGWVAQRDGSDPIVLFPPERITRRLPRTVEPAIDAAYLDRQVADLRGRYLVTVDGARLVGPHGLVVLPDGSYAAESVYSREVLETEPDFAEPRRRRHTIQRGDYFSLVVNWSHAGNYYHWFHDTLTRLFGVIDALPPGTRFIVPADLRPFQAESLRVLGITGDQLVAFDGELVWELERLHFAPPVTSSGSDRREADVWLRDRILHGYEIDASVERRRIFVSRRDARAGTSSTSRRWRTSCAGTASTPSSPRN